MDFLPLPLLREQMRHGGRGVGRVVIERAAPLIVEHPAPPAPARPAREFPSDPGGNSAVEIVPVSPGDRSGNPMRPITLDGMVGQEELKPLLRRLIAVARSSRRPLSHLLMIGAAGTGKTTMALVVANELGSRFFELEAPVSTETLLALREKARPGDVIFIDEIHQQSRGDRRGKVASMEPEAMYRLLEDGQMIVGGRVLDFPPVTFIGATTDPGLLPEAFLARFPLQPRLKPYSDAEMAELARRNARAVGVTLTPEAAAIFGAAARDVPRIVNRYIENARSLATGAITGDTAREVVRVLNGTTLDGLTADMQRYLAYLLSQPRVIRGEVRYQSGVNAIASALGYSRDSKGVALHVEPYLIERGLVQVVHGGRILTPAGIRRANTL